MFSRGKHYDKVVKETKEPTPLYLQEGGKQASAVYVDIGQDFFWFKMCF